MSLYLFRTDYSDDAAWQSCLVVATKAYDGEDFESLGAEVTPVDNPSLEGLTPQQLERLDGNDFEFLVADARTMRDHTFLVVYNTTTDPADAAALMADGISLEPFRVLPEQLEGIVANLSLANLDFWELAPADDETRP